MRRLFHVVMAFMSIAVALYLGIAMFKADTVKDASIAMGAAFGWMFSAQIWLKDARKSR